MFAWDWYINVYVLKLFIQEKVFWTPHVNWIGNVTVGEKLQSLRCTDSYSQLRLFSHRLVMMVCDMNGQVWEIKIRDVSSTIYNISSGIVSDIPGWAFTRKSPDLFSGIPVSSCSNTGPWGVALQDLLGGLLVLILGMRKWWILTNSSLLEMIDKGHGEEHFMFSSSKNNSSSWILSSTENS